MQCPINCHKLSREQKYQNLTNTIKLHIAFCIVTDQIYLLSDFKHYWWNTEIHEEILMWLHWLYTNLRMCILRGI